MLTLSSERNTDFEESKDVNDEQKQQNFYRVDDKYQLAAKADQNRSNLKRREPIIE